MIRKRSNTLFGCVVAASLSAASTAHALPTLPEPPSFANPNYLQIDVTTWQVVGPPCNTITPKTAVANDGIDDSCVVQHALNAVEEDGGGVVYIPEGTFDIHRTLIVSDRTWVVGAGSATLLRRGPNASNHNSYQVSQEQCSGPSKVSSHALFVNKDYNCGNWGITLFNFSIDASQIQIGNPTIAFSAVTNTHIWNLAINDSQGDGIYLHNGGVRTSVRHNSISGFKSSGINIEMVGNGFRGDESNSIPNRRPPVILFGNTVQSEPGHNGQGISVSRATSSFQLLGEKPSVLIQNNDIDVTDGQTGIRCLECIESMIVGNTVRSAASLGNGAFTGIHASGFKLRVLNNRIYGNGHGNAIDGPGILVHHAESNDIASTDALIIGNIVANKNIDPQQSTAGIEISGLTRFAIKNNRVEEIWSVPGIAVGHCQANSLSTHEGFVASNSVSMSDGSPGYILRRADSDIHFINNQLDGMPLLLNDIALCDSPEPIQL